MTDILITGDSHLAALRRAQDEHPAKDRISFVPLGPGGRARSRFFAIEDGGKTVAITEPDWTQHRFNREAMPSADAKLFLSLPLNTSRIHRLHGWERHVPWSLKRDEREIPLSDSMLDAMIDADSRHTIAFAVALKEAGLDVSVVAAPTLFAHHPVLEQAPEGVPAFVEDRYRARVSKQLSEAGIPIIEQPAETLDGDGRTSTDFSNPRSHDVHHGNVDYGRLTLDKIVAAAG